ncbi:MAG: thiamine pyrophosphate-binding protein, partial [Alphaproteobacteria bacterium]|nr:thiamine pyrophosphate-binding protein [Alphaproteobacteria bacterium]
MPTAAQIVAQRLYDAGVRHAFGIPGGEVLTLMQAMDRAGIRIRLCKHEGAGGFMAEGLHYMTGGPTVLFATLGPGAANAANAIVNADQERVPLIFLTGCMDPADTPTYTHQVFDHGAVFRPVTRASIMLQDGAVA